MESLMKQFRFLVFYVDRIFADWGRKASKCFRFAVILSNITAMIKKLRFLSKHKIAFLNGSDNIELNVGRIKQMKTFVRSSCFFRFPSCDYLRALRQRVNFRLFLFYLCSQNSLRSLIFTFIIIVLFYRNDKITNKLK